MLWYWATFGTAGGPPTLELRGLPGNCYSVQSLDDAGKRARTARRDAARRRQAVPRSGAGRACIGKHTGLVRATAAGAVRSNAVQ